MKKTQSILARPSHTPSPADKAQPITEAAKRQRIDERKEKQPLTLPEIRALVSKSRCDYQTIEKEVAAAFTREGADEEEKAFLTICRAIYRRSEDVVFQDNAPAEKLIKALVFDISFWPLTLEHVKHELELTESDWEQREEAARIVREEIEETVALRGSRNVAGRGAA